MISGGFSLAYYKVLPEFERSTGIAVTTLSGASQGAGPKTIKYQLEAGAEVDVVIMSKEGLGELIAVGRIVAGSDAELATAALGAAVRTGHPKPDISSVEAFKRAVLGARLVAIPASTSGIFVKEEVFPRLGIADKVSSRMMARGAESTALLAAGEADLAIRAGERACRSGGDRANRRAARRFAAHPDVHGGYRQDVAQAGAGPAVDRIPRVRDDRESSPELRNGAGRSSRQSLATSR
jgi:ABC-type molybdate transport system substrate-binding protein